MAQPGNLQGGKVDRAGGQQAAFGPRATGTSIHSPCPPSSSRRLSWEEGMDSSSGAPSAERPPPPLSVSGVGLIPTIGGRKNCGWGGEDAGHGEALLRSASISHTQVQKLDPKGEETLKSYEF